MAASNAEFTAIDVTSPAVNPPVSSATGGGTTTKLSKKAKRAAAAAEAAANNPLPTARQLPPTDDPDDPFARPPPGPPRVDAFTGVVMGPGGPQPTASPTRKAPIVMHKLVLAVVVAVCFVFTVIGTPLPQLSFKNNSAQLQLWITLWNLEADVLGKHYAISNDDWACKSLAQMLHASAAFAIIAIAMSLTTLVFLVLEILRKPIWRFAPGGFGIAYVVAIVICWALIAVINNNAYCGQIVYSQFFDYGAGFALFVTAFCILTVPLTVWWLKALGIMGNRNRSATTEAL